MISIMFGWLATAVLTPSYCVNHRQDPDCGKVYKMIATAEVLSIIHTFNMDRLMVSEWEIDIILKYTIAY